MKDQLKEIYEKVVKRYGSLQLIKAQEELSELSIEISKIQMELNRPGIFVDWSNTEIESEIADVLNMIYQLIILLDLSEEIIEAKMQDKMFRTVERMNESE